MIKNKKQNFFDCQQGVHSKTMKQIFILVFAVITTTTAFSQDEFTLVKDGEKAPDFTYEASPGKTAKLSDLKGKVVWINFFATWCGPCLKELPHLEKEVFEKYKDNNNFKLLVIGREHTWEEVAGFKTEKDINLPFYPDPGRKIFSKFARQNIPRNFIIDKNGNIAIASVGFTEKEFEELNAKLEELLLK